MVSFESCTAKWKAAFGWDLSDVTRAKLAVNISGHDIRPTDIRIWEGGLDDGAKACKVPLEFLFAGAPHVDEEQFRLVLTNAVEEFVREEQREEFRTQLFNHKNMQLRRRSSRGASSEQLEGGDREEEKWRDFLHKPCTSDTVVRIHRVHDAGYRARRVLSCQVWVATDAAHLLGKRAYAHVFEQDDAKPDSVSIQASAETQFLICWYFCLALIVLLVVLWLSLFINAIRTR